MTPVRALILTALLAVAAVSAPTSVWAEDPDVVEDAAVLVAATPAIKAPATPDSSATLTLSARAAYEAAWAQREAGDHATAVATAEATLATLDRALEGDLDA